MNGRAAKLLRYVAALENADYKELKRGWKRMSHIERGNFRRRYR